jgi:hypothetical protein
MDEHWKEEDFKGIRRSNLSLIEKILLPLDLFFIREKIEPKRNDEYSVQQENIKFNDLDFPEKILLPLGMFGAGFTLGSTVFNLDIKYIIASAAVTMTSLITAAYHKTYGSKNPIIGKE